MVFQNKKKKIMKYSQKEHRLIDIEVLVIMRYVIQISLFLGVLKDL